MPASTDIAPQNFRAGRPAGFTPDSIVLHRTGGTVADLRRRFASPPAGCSAHYIVGRDGTVIHCLEETDTAFHAGAVAQPTWARIRPGVNPNFHTIGIEFEGNPPDNWPDAQVAAAGRLVREVAGRWRIPLDADHVIPHRMIRPSSGCPALTCPVGRIIAAAREVTGHAHGAQLAVRTRARANLRIGAPGLDAPIARTIPEGADVPVSEFTDAGDPVDGNPCWFGDGRGHYLWAGATTTPQPAGDPVFSQLPRTRPPSSDAMELTPLPAAPATGDPLTIDRTTFVLAPQEFVPEVTAKDLLVLHFTAGTSARSAYDTWRNDPRRIATAYIVDLDGTIYEVFPPGCWASHLGVASPRSILDRRSIGIEIVNAGPLQPSAEDRDVLNWWPRRTRTSPEFTTRFCRLEEHDRYVAAAFRGKTHFAAYPAAQVDAVAALVHRVCDEFGIPKALPALARRFTADAAAFTSYTGVCSHANLRADKWDIGPAFPWERLGL
jgi:N-acetyl-anhydromuramyl-L-alanine amidase AmpD